MVAKVIVLHLWDTRSQWPPRASEALTETVAGPRPAPPPPGPQAIGERKADGRGEGIGEAQSM
jgi:hypothetical protein